eukprot:CAMPEP_0172045204 /NCGR_PEP_ID=MMETSP1041-20130122/27216_1 /TAXON_ID=464988 /ORGANISM="Hemiselmis andersenii, Strain CCMP439" /LENGTH=31 /DNA_ID= /DNA_START= /DNA_END= /DNA_ORIENTATION=
MSMQLQSQVARKPYSSMPDDEGSDFDTDLAV